MQIITTEIVEFFRNIKQGNKLDEFIDIYNNKLYNLDTGQKYDADERISKLIEGL